LFSALAGLRTLFKSTEPGWAHFVLSTNNDGYLEPVEIFRSKSKQKVGYRPQHRIRLAACSTAVVKAGRLAAPMDSEELGTNDC
jgi:hypothetical protein